MIDAVLEEALQVAADKYQAGVAEYGGKGLGEADLSIVQLLKDIREEAIDTIMYTTAALQKIERLTLENLTEVNDA